MAGLLDGLLNGDSSGDGSGLLSFLNSLGMGPGMPPADPSASFSDRFGAATPPAFGAPPASIIGANSPTGTMPNLAAAPDAPPTSFADRFGAAPAPAFGAGASPMLFASAPGSTPGNPALPSAPGAPPIVAQDDSEDDAPASPIGVGGYQMPRVGDASAFTPDPAALPVNSQPTQGQLAPATPAPAAPSNAWSSAMNRGADALQSIANGGSLLGAVRGQYDDPNTKTAKIANQTARALIAKGVDPQMAIAAVQPGNTEMLKTLVTQTFGPKTLTSLGEGYVADKDGNVKRAYTPEDKTPTSALEYNYYKDNLPPGQKPMDYATFSDAKSRVEAQNPNKNQTLGRGGEIIHNNPDGTVTVVHKNESEQPAPMDPASLEILARREIGGDFSGRKNLGRGAQGAADLKAITNKSADILTNEMGMTPTEAAAHLVKKQQEYNAQGQGLNAEARTTGVREANLNLILKAADAAIPAALEASDKVPRTGWVPVNQIVQHGEVMTSNPELKQFGMANLQLAEHWARAMNPTGVMRDQDRDIALSFLSTADSKETYKAAVGQLRTQIERERDAVRSTRGMSDLPGSAATPSTPAAPPVPSGWTVQVH